MQTALADLEALNPGVLWDFASLNCADPCGQGHCSITAELRLTEIPMRVNRDGILIAKWPPFNG
jgi:hypothetical protein